MASGKDVRAGKAFVELYIKNNAFIKGLRAAQQKLRDFGAGVATVGKWMMGVGATMIAPFALATKTFMSAGDAMDKMSARTGVSTNALSELGFAAEQSGSSIEEIESSIRRMQKTIGTGKGEAITRLGLSLDKIKAMSPEEQFEAVAAAIDAIKDPTAKAAAAMEIFGKTGTSLLPMLGSIKQLRAEARELGLSISPEDAKNAAALGDAWNRVKRSISGGFFAIGAAIAPALTTASDAITKIVQIARKWIVENQGIIRTVAKVAVGVTAAGAAFVVLGGTIVALMNPVNWVLAGLAALGWKFRDTIGTILGEFSDAWDGIVAAVSAGDLSAAWAIVGTTMRIQWLRLTTFLKSKWEGTKEFFFKNFPGLAMALNDVIATMRSAWAGLMGWMQKKWTDFKTSTFTEQAAGVLAGWFGDSYKNAEMAEAKKVSAWRKGGVDEMEIAKRLGDGNGGLQFGKDQSYYDRLLSSGQGQFATDDEVQRALKEDMARARAQAEADKAEIDTATEETKAAIEAARKRWEQAIEAGTDVEGRDELTRMQQELEDAKAAASEAVTAAKAVRTLPDKNKDGPDGPPDFEATQAALGRVAGTFSGSALGGMGVGSDKVVQRLDGLLRESRKQTFTFKQVLAETRKTNFDLKD
jgi:hypothetical protein